MQTSKVVPAVNSRETVDSSGPSATNKSVFPPRIHLKLAGQGPALRRGNSGPVAPMGLASPKPRLPSSRDRGADVSRFASPTGSTKQPRQTFLQTQCSRLCRYEVRRYRSRSINPKEARFSGLLSHHGGPKDLGKGEMTPVWSNSAPMALSKPY